MSNNPATIKVTVDDFSRYIANKRDFYDAMVANGYYMPKYKTTMITEEYMRDILGGKTFCPHYKDVNCCRVQDHLPSSCCSGSSTASAKAAIFSITAALMSSVYPTRDGCLTS